MKPDAPFRKDNLPEFQQDDPKCEVAASPGQTPSVERARKAHRGDDAAEIKAAMDELSAAYQEAGRSLYSQTQSEPSAAPGPEAGATAGAETPGGGAKPDDVVEADYEIVDDKK